MSPWARIDDTFHSHPKVLYVWKRRPRALGLHALAISYCARYLTDGVVNRSILAQWEPNGRALQADCKVLASADLWHPHGDDWAIHHWLDYNPSREQVLAERAANAKRQADWRDRRNASTNALRNAVTDSPADAPRNAVSNAAPSHTQPFKEKKEEERKERPPFVRQPQRRLGGPTAAEANAAALSWAQRKEQLTQGERDEP